jgi:hypothetical protein
VTVATDPKIITLPADEWTLIVAGAANGFISIPMEGANVVYFQTTRVSVIDPVTVASEVEQLALVVVEGDFCYRSDEDKSYIALNALNVDMSDWQELLPPPENLLTPDVADFEGVTVYYRLERIAGKSVPVGGSIISSSVPRDIYVYPWSGEGKIILVLGE